MAEKFGIKIKSDVTITNRSICIQITDENLSKCTNSCFILTCNLYVCSNVYMHGKIIPYISMRDHLRYIIICAPPRPIGCFICFSCCCIVGYSTAQEHLSRVSSGQPFPIG